MLRKLVAILMLAVFLAGLLLVMYPYIQGAIVDQEIHLEAEGFLNREPPTVTEPYVETISPDLPTVPRDYPQLWTDMAAYNETIYAQGQSGLSCAYDYQKASFRLSDYGLDSEVFGVIEIPAMELSMPIYLGATSQHMADGAAHLSQTSLPIGGKNTNSVIAGHRGYGGASYFRYIDKLKAGDTVTVTNLWEVLTYRVTEIRIIYPYEVEHILIQEGRELLTLLTCHPYASGGKQRYVVYCERIPEAEEKGLVSG